MGDKKVKGDDIISLGIEDSELQEAPKLKTVDFDGSLADYFSDMLIEEGHSSKEGKQKADVLIFTVKDEDDSLDYIEKTGKRREYMENAVYVKPPSKLDSVSLEHDINEFLYYLKVKGVTPLRSEEDVKDYYKEITNEEA